MNVLTKMVIFQETLNVQYSYTYLFLQILILSFYISLDQFKKCASFWHNGGVIRVNKLMGSK